MSTTPWKVAGLMLVAGLVAGMSCAGAASAADADERPVAEQAAEVGKTLDAAPPAAKEPPSAPAAPAQPAAKEPPSAATKPAPPAAKEPPSAPAEPAQPAAAGVEAQVTDDPNVTRGAEGMRAAPSDAPQPAQPSCTEAGTWNYETCLPLSSHRSGVFAEGLYLHVGNADVVYAVEQTGCDPALASPTGRVGQVSMDWEPGFRAGFTLALSECASVVATYTGFESDSASSIVAAPGRVLASQVTHPSQANCGAAATWANAQQQIGLQLADLDYRRLWCGGCDWAINWTGGLRYAHLTQDFWAQQNTTNGLTDVTTEIDFDGFGIRFGLDGERRSAYTGLAIYAKAFANFVAGDLHADYRHTNQFGATAVIGNTLEEWRVLTILEAELGLAWHSPCDHWRLSTGYNFAGIYNILTTKSYLEDIRRGGVGEEDDLLTLTGLVARVEWRY